MGKGSREIQVIVHLEDSYEPIRPPEITSTKFEVNENITFIGNIEADVSDGLAVKFEGLDHEESDFRAGTDIRDEMTPDRKPQRTII